MKRKNSSKPLSSHAPDVHTVRILSKGYGSQLFAGLHIARFQWGEFKLTMLTMVRVLKKVVIKLCNLHAEVKLLHRSASLWHCFNFRKLSQTVQLFIWPGLLCLPGRYVSNQNSYLFVHSHQSSYFSVS